MVGLEGPLCCCLVLTQKVPVRGIEVGVSALGWQPGRAGCTSRC